MMKGEEARGSVILSCARTGRSVTVRETFPLPQLALQQLQCVYLDLHLQIQAAWDWHRLVRNGTWIWHLCQVPILPSTPCLHTHRAVCCLFFPPDQIASCLTPPYLLPTSPDLAKLCQLNSLFLWFPHQHGEAGTHLCTDLSSPESDANRLYGTFVTLANECKGFVPVWLIIALEVVNLPASSLCSKFIS